MKIDRLLAIILLLQSRGRMTASELAKIFEVSVRTIYRDIDSLLLAAVPIIPYPGLDGGYALTDDYKINPLAFSADEAASLFLGGGIIEGQKIDLAEAAKKAMIKMEAILPPECKEDIEKIRSKIYFDATGWDETERQEGTLEILRRAIVENEELFFRYPSQCRFIPEKRQVDPYGLVSKAGAWYVVAFCHHLKSFQIFRVDRLREARKTGRHFEPLQDFDIAEFWQQALTDVKPRRKSVKMAKIKIYPVLSDVVKHFVWAGESMMTEKDGSLILQLPIINYGQVTDFILQFGEHAEVLEPEELRRKVGERAARIAARYSKEG